MSIEKTKPAILTSAVKTYTVLDVLCRNFATGMTVKEVAEACTMPSPTAVMCLNTLIEVGYAEKIISTDRYRASIGFAQKAMSLMRSIEKEQQSIDQLNQRINTGI